MRAANLTVLVAVGAALAYLITRQVAPQTLDSLGATVGDVYENIIARFEGFRSEPYQDDAGIWTIGFGHRIVKGDGFWHPDFNPDGIKTISAPDARALYASDTQAAQNAVDTAVRVPLSASQNAALVSLAYNIGAGNFRSSTLVRKLNAGDYASAADQFLVWNKVTVNGELVESAGLINRREKEREIFLT